jgi:two-component system chemotaxis response regulator CheB
MAAVRIRTVLIEDSGFMRILLSDLLRKDETIDVVGTATNGQDGVEKVKALKPDVVITDMVMPQFDGLYVVQQLMKDMPIPIILLSSLDRADPKIFDALKEGAFDFIDKPQNKEASHGYFPLTQMIRDASLADYGKLRQRVKSRNTHVHTFDTRLSYDVIVIGASTGGPSAIEFILNNLPSNLTIPIIVAQHMPNRFIESFATRLASTTPLHVNVLKDGEEIAGNHIYMAPGTANVRISLSGSCPVARHVKESYKEFNHPSINCLFESIATVYGNRAIGVVLTGMGKDGATGLKKIKEAGGLTVAQDELSSVVYGMPKVAFECGAARHQLSLKEIPNFIISAL